jgi:hypothetical protein
MQECKYNIEQKKCYVRVNANILNEVGRQVRNLKNSRECSTRIG